MFWTKVSKALSDIILVVALVMSLMIGEGLNKMLDSSLAGVVGYILGIVVTIGANIAIKSLLATSAELTVVMDKLQVVDVVNRYPNSLEELEDLEKELNEMGKENEEDEIKEIKTIIEKWKGLAIEIKIVWVEVLIFIVAIFMIAYKISEISQYGAILALGLGLVANMLITAIIGTAVENHYRLQRVKYLMKTRNIRKKIKKNNS